MGSAVIAECACGLEAESRIGGGMLDFRSVCHFPCLCEACQSAVEVDLLKRPLRCPSCGTSDPIPYDDPRLLGTPGSRVVAEWDMTELLGRRLELTDGTYRCPGCGNPTLHFSDSGLRFD